MRVASAGVWQHPQRGGSETLFLFAERRPRPHEPESISADPQHRDRGGPEPGYFAGQALPPAHELFSFEFVRGSRRPRHEVRDPAARVEEFTVRIGLEALQGESRQVQCRPEAIPRPREMMPGGGRVESRIDTAEEHVEPGSNDVRDSPGARRGERSRRNLTRGSHQALRDLGACGIHTAPLEGVSIALLTFARPHHARRY